MKEKQKEPPVPDSVNSSFSGDEFDQITNQINIEKSEKVPERILDSIPYGLNNKKRIGDNLPNNELVATIIDKKDDFIENLFSNKNNNNYYPDNKIVTSKDFADLPGPEVDDFPMKKQGKVTSKYNLDEDEDGEEADVEKEIKKNKSLDSELRNTIDMTSYIRENEELAKQSNNLDTFCNFAVKSLKHLVPKLMNNMEKDKPNQDELNRLLNNPGNK